MGDRARRLQLQRRRLELLHGRLTNDRADELKLDASYEFPQRPLSGLNVAVSVHWFSGIPLTAYGSSFAGGSPEYFLTPRGALGTGPSDWEADVHADYGWTLNGERRVHLVANIFNVFNRQGITQLDERYNLAQNGPCAGIPDGACNGTAASRRRLARSHR